MSTHNYDDLRKSEPPTQDPEYAAKNPSVPAPDNQGDNPIPSLPSEGLWEPFFDALQAMLDSPEYVRSVSAGVLKGNGGVPAYLANSPTGKVHSESELQSYMPLHGGASPLNRLKVNHPEDAWSDPYAPPAPGGRWRYVSDGPLVDNEDPKNQVYYTLVGKPGEIATFGGGPATVSPETQKESFEQFKYHTYRFSYWDELRFWIDEALRRT